MLDQLLEIGFLTGSRAFETYQENSDYDIVYSVEDTAKIQDIIGETEKQHSEYFGGYFVTDGDTLINLIPVHPHDYLPWYLATKAVAATLELSGITDPIKKYSVFMGIVSLFKGVVDRQGNLAGYEKIKECIRQNSKNTLTL